MANGTVLAEILLEGGATFRRGIESAGDSLDDTARDATTMSGALSFAGEKLQDVRGNALEAAFALGRLDAQADDAGDELVEAGGQATTAGALFGTASVGTNGLNLSLVTMSGTITGVAIPALAALATTVAPLAATLGGVAAAAGGLAGAFGAIVGSGALAYGEQLSAQYQEQLLRVEDQIEALEEQREAQGDLTDAQRQELRQLKQRKQELDDVEGAMSALQVRLGDVASEVGSIVAEWGTNFAPLIRDAIDAIPSLVRSVLDAVGNLSDFRDVLRQLGGEAARSLPAVASTLVDVGREALPFFIDGLRWLQQNGGSAFDRILQTTRTVAPLIADVGRAFTDALPSINRFGTAVLQGVLPALADGTRGFGDLLNQILAFTQTQQFNKIMSEVSATVADLRPEVSLLVERFGALFGTLVENAPAFIRLFREVADAVLDIANFVIPIVNTLIDVIGEFAQLTAGLFEFLEVNESDPSWGEFLGLNDTTLPTAGPAATARRIESGSGGPREVVVTVDDERFDAYVDDRAGQRVNESERRRSRRVLRQNPD